MSKERYDNMKPEELQEYISALVDKDAAGLTDEDITVLQHVVQEQPGLLSEYRLNLATRLCLLRQARTIRCPEHTSEAIRSILYHMYKSRRETL